MTSETEVCSRAEAASEQPVEKVLVLLHELELGKPLPWPVFDENDCLLLNQGFVVANARQRDLILRRGGKRPVEPESDKPATLSSVGEAKLYTLYELMEYLLCRQEAANRAIFNRQTSLTHLLVGKLALDIQYLVEACPNRLLAILLLDDGALYQLIHPLHTAVLCEMLACELDWPREKRLPLLCAALTHDLAIQEAQKEIDQQSGPVSDAQWQEIRQHCFATAELLEAAGVTHKGWLELVRCHHERLDGSGYPRGLEAQQLPQAARMLQLADTFSAMMRYRGHRDALDTHNILLSLYRNETEQYDKQLILKLIDAVGLIVPGSLVKLHNGMLAIARARGQTSSAVELMVLLDERGKPVSPPMEIDPGLAEYGVAGFVGRDQYRWLLGNVASLWPPISLVLD